MAESKHTVEVELTIDATETIEALRATADMLEALKPKPAPIAVGDYVRLTGERWGEHMGKVVRVARAESEIEYAAVKIDGSVWYITPNWTADRITVTADLDDPWNLPLPEVGEHVWVEYLDGSFWNGQVRHVSGNRVTFDEASALFEKHIESSALDWHGGAWVAAWGTYDPAGLTPAEPTTFGYVGYVTDADGDVWDVTRDCDKSTQEDKRHRPYAVVSRADGSRSVGMSWSWLTDNYGTFTAVERFEYCGKGPCAQENGHDGECKC